MIAYLPKSDGNKVQGKLQKSIMESISQLETK